MTIMSEEKLTANPLTKQEMFDRAWNGLRSQNWERSVSCDPAGKVKSCNYLTKKEDGTVTRCAWGHVDPEGTALADEDPETRNKGVSVLHRFGVGLAQHLVRGKGGTLEFTRSLQTCHDNPGYVLLELGLPASTTPEQQIEMSLRRLADQHGLTIPGEDLK